MKENLHQSVTKQLSKFAVAPVLAVAAAVSGCGGDKTNDYPQAAISSFMSSCNTSSGGETAYCACAMHGIQSKYNYEEYVRLNVRTANTGQLPEELSGIISKCTAR